MRTIKFRGKILSEQRWVCGSLLAFPNGLCHILVPRAYATTPDSYCVDPKTLGQLTGIKDRSGINIYEGDIVQISSRGDSRTCEVVWEPKIPGFILHSPSDPWHLHTSWAYDSIEIIGNIHDHSRLRPRDASRPIEIGDYVRNSISGKFGYIKSISSDGLRLAVLTINRSLVSWKTQNVQLIEIASK